MRRGGGPGVSKKAKQDPSPMEKQGIEKMLNGRERKVKFSK